MSEKDTGGPAFPVPMFSIGHAKYEAQQQGLTLRDYFAAKAMQGLMTRKEQGGFDFAVYEKDAMRVALWAYDLADEMLKARKV